MSIPGPFMATMNPYTHPRPARTAPQHQAPHPDNWKPQLPAAPPAIAATPIQPAHVLPGANWPSLPGRQGDSGQVPHPASLVGKKSKKRAARDPCDNNDSDDSTYEWYMGIESTQGPSRAQSAVGKSNLANEV